MRSVTALLLLLPALAAADGPSGRDRLERAFENQYGADLLAAVELSTQGGGRTPAHVRFAYGLKRSGPETRTLLYLPDAGRDAPRALLLQRRGERDLLFMSRGSRGQVQPLATGTESWSLFGSDFSYADFRAHSIDDYAVETLGPDRIAGESALALRLRPRSGPYQQLVVWVADTRPVLLRVDYFDRGGLWKRYTADPRRIRRHVDRWLATDDQMHDLRTGTRTRRRIRNVMATGMPEALFTVTQLARGRLPSF